MGNVFSLRPNQNSKGNNNTKQLMLTHINQGRISLSFVSKNLSLHSSDYKSSRDFFILITDSKVNIFLHISNLILLMGSLENLFFLHRVPLFKTHGTNCCQAIYIFSLPSHHRQKTLLNANDPNTNKK